jgi:hypothetical protein
MVPIFLPFSSPLLSFSKLSFAVLLFPPTLFRSERGKEFVAGGMREKNKRTNGQKGDLLGEHGAERLVEADGAVGDALGRAFLELLHHCRG